MTDNQQYQQPDPDDVIADGQLHDSWQQLPPAERASYIRAHEHEWLRLMRRDSHGQLDDNLLDRDCPGFS